MDGGGKDPSIQTLRGLAILLVVFFHVTVFSDPVSAPDIRPITGWADPINELLRYIRMPLFTVISGWVYALHPVRSGSLSGFIMGKARRILLPWLLLTFIHFSVNHLMKYGLSVQGLGMMKHMLMYPYGHLWFLTALFLIMLAVAPIERLGWMQRPGGWLLCMGGACVLSAALTSHVMITYLSWGVTEFWGLGRAVYLLPFFVLGCGLCRFKWLDQHTSAWIIGTGGILVAGLSCQIFLWMRHLRIDGTAGDEVRWLALWVGLSGGAFLLAARRRWAPLAWLGERAYVIFLFHLLAIILVRNVLKMMIDLERVNLAGSIAIVGISMAAAVLLPLAINVIVVPLPMARRVVLGMR